MDEPNELAAAIQGEMMRRSWSQVEVAAAGGPSTTTQSAISAGKSVSRQSLAKVDVAFGWAAGTAARLYRGDTLASFVLAGNLEPDDPRSNYVGWRPKPSEGEEPPADGLREWTTEADLFMAQLSDRLDAVEELLAKLMKQGGQKDAGDAEAEKTSNEGVRPNVTPETQTLAARRGDSRGKRQANFTDQLGQELQDDGGWEPA